MKIAIPVAKNQLCTHFGHCENFMFFDVDPDTKSILKGYSYFSTPRADCYQDFCLKKGQPSNSRRHGWTCSSFSYKKELRLLPVLTQLTAVRRHCKTYLSGALQTGANPCDH